ncbi:flippase-like domain-containing protein [bacterium]|nr:flippase-like domain-containing protein [bacterium]
MFFVAKHQQPVIQWLNRVTKNHNFIKQKIVPQLEKLIQGFGMLTKPSQFFLSLFWIALTWVLWVTTYYLGVIQMAPGAPLWWGIFVCSIIALGVALPSAPAGVGVFEASMVAALSLLGVDSSSALAYAVIMHFSQVIIAVILGVWGLMREKQSLTSLVSSLPLKTSSSITQD